ncbi:MAG: hypothetical protein E6K53_06480 [Gammaproteobacteria bacterium]|nr:MAG: hypothetical protein E6K53_06480 [Gammaproteobacteria bacterium]
MNRIPLMFLALIAQAADDRVPMPNCVKSCIDEAKAVSIAENEFLKFTHKKITRYSIRMARQTDAAWLYVVSGRGEFARPGYQWFISIERASGKVLSIDEGE